MGWWQGVPTVSQNLPIYEDVPYIDIASNSVRFWLNYIKSGTESAQRHFIEAFETYLNAVTQQTIDRCNNYIRDFDSFMLLRTASSGSLVAITICEVHLNLPDSVLMHPIIARMTELAAHLIVFCNDLWSYKVE